MNWDKAFVKAGYIGERLCDILYPPRCPVCDGLLKLHEKPVHEECRRKLTYAAEPLCKKCGKPLREREEEYCFDCAGGNRKIDEGRAVFVYDRLMKQSIYRFKYRNRREYAAFYCREMAGRMETVMDRWRPDILIPVPMFGPKERKRGFNQAELLARGLGKRYGLPVGRDIVIRCRKTTPQKELNYEDRQNNLKKAFKIVKNDVKLSTSVIIDDIYTTGSTADAVADALKHAGADKVYCISLAIGRGL